MKGGMLNNEVLAKEIIQAIMSNDLVGVESVLYEIDDNRFSVKDVISWSDETLDVISNVINQHTA